VEQIKGKQHEKSGSRNRQMLLLRARVSSHARVCSGQQRSTRRAAAIHLRSIHSQRRLREHYRSSTKNRMSREGHSRWLGLCRLAHAEEVAMPVDYEWGKREALVCFDCGGNGLGYVFRRCPKCGRFISEGKFLTNGLGEVKLVGWMCSKCGEVKPAWFW